MIAYCNSKPPAHAMQTTRLAKLGLVRYGGVLPYAVHPVSGSIVYLLARENDTEGAFSDFGGGPDPSDGRNGTRTAARECYEESMGLFGSADEIEQRLSGKRSVHLDDGTVFLMRTEYDPRLPLYFGRFYAYAIQCANITSKDARCCVSSCPEGHFEKSEVRWLTIEQMRTVPLRAFFIQAVEQLRALDPSVLLNEEDRRRSDT